MPTATHGIWKRADGTGRTGQIARPRARGTGHTEWQIMTTQDMAIVGNA